MLISDIKESRIVPFEIEDQKLVKLFSFYLHRAPTIDSNSALFIEEKELEEKWGDFLGTFSLDQFTFISAQCQIEKYLSPYNLSDESVVSRKQKGFVCKKKASSEPDFQCFLRHIRNAIAHSNVFLFNTSRRKYILFEDYNSTKKMSARILVSQTDLSKLKILLYKVH